MSAQGLQNQLRASKAVMAALIAQAAEIGTVENCEMVIRQAGLVSGLASELKALIEARSPK